MLWPLRLLSSPSHYLVPKKHGLRCKALSHCFLLASVGPHWWVALCTVSSDDLSRGSKLLWPVTLILLGFTSLVVWRLGALLVFPRGVVVWVTRIALIEFVLYLLLVLFVRRDFIIAIANYLPAVLFLTLSFGFRFLRRSNSSILAGIAGLFLTFVAAAVQHFKISLHPQYFNHNAFYHLLQGVALFLLFISARYLIRNSTTTAFGETRKEYAHKA
jgi:hypothetical protein